MNDRTFLSDIPEATDLEQEEFLSPEGQAQVSFIIRQICQTIRENRDQLIQGKRVETISFGRDEFGRPDVRDSYNRSLHDEGRPVHINSVILKIVIRCLQLKGYKVQISPGIFSWLGMLWTEILECSSTSPRRRIYVSVERKKAIVRVDDLALMQAVEHVFDQALGDAGDRR